MGTLWTLVAILDGNGAWPTMLHAQPGATLHTPAEVNFQAWGGGGFTVGLIHAQGEGHPASAGWAQGLRGDHVVDPRHGVIFNVRRGAPLCNPHVKYRALGSGTTRCEAAPT